MCYVQKKALAFYLNNFSRYELRPNPCTLAHLDLDIRKHLKEWIMSTVPTTHDCPYYAVIAWCTGCFCISKNIFQWLVQSGLSFWKLPLMQNYRREKWRLCADRDSWITDWHTIVFTDKYRFCFAIDSLRVNHRWRDDKYNYAATVKIHIAWQPDIMVWGPNALTIGRTADGTSCLKTWRHVDSGWVL